MLWYGWLFGYEENQLRCKPKINPVLFPVIEKVEYTIWLLHRVQVVGTIKEGTERTAYHPRRNSM